MSHDEVDDYSNRNLTLADVEKAIKKISPVKAGYVLIDLSYSESIILPIKEATSFINALSKAEKFEHKYNKGETNYLITGGEIGIKFSLVSAQKYSHIKAAQILNVPYHTLVEFLEKQDKEETQEDSKET